MPRGVVIGLGNPLRGDDGVGAAVIAELKKHELAPWVQLIDAGTAGLETALLLEGHDQAVLVDATNHGAEPGDWCSWRVDSELLNDYRCGFTTHAAGLKEAIVLAEALCILPPLVVLVGIQPLNLEFGPDLSPPVRAVVPAVAEAILDLLGASPRERLLGLPHASRRL